MLSTAASFLRAQSVSCRRAAATSTTPPSPAPPQRSWQCPLLAFGSEARFDSPSDHVYRRQKSFSARSDLKGVNGRAQDRVAVVVRTKKSRARSKIPFGPEPSRPPDIGAGLPCGRHTLGDSDPLARLWPLYDLLVARWPYCAEVLIYSGWTPPCITSGERRPTMRYCLTMAGTMTKNQCTTKRNTLTKTNSGKSKPFARLLSIICMSSV